MRPHPPCRWARLGALLLLGAAVVPRPAPAAGEDAVAQVETDWGGHLKARGRIGWPEPDSLAGASSADPLFDGSLEGRVINTLFLGEGTRFETHYEAVLTGGDTRRRLGEAVLLLPVRLPAGFVSGRIPEDDRRLFDLTHVLHADEDTLAYHRLDRLVLTFTPDWGVLSVGRQAVTWGHGLLFNPMDLFNPFAPTDIERDYKIGDDLLLIQVPAPAGGDLQLLYVPRRDPATGELAGDQDSLAGKLHLARGVTEFDVLAASHYDDAVFGIGAVGYAGGAAWRLDATWTHLAGKGRGDYLSLVANLDYSWVWTEKNWYGFLEVFYSGIGEEEGEYGEALAAPEIIARLDRGELFTVGRTYLGGQVQVELHPLVNAFLTAIVNAADPSGILQPRLSWDAAQDLRLLIGGTLLLGGRGTEFGGFPIPGTPFTTRAADSLYGWLSWYF